MKTERFPPLGALAVCLAVSAPTALAATPAAADTAAPASATAAEPTPPIFRSAFDGYRRYRDDQPLADWRAVNDLVGGLGGHIGQYGQPDPTPAPDPAEGAPR